MGTWTWQWTGKLNLDWVDWGKVVAIYKEVYGDRTIPVKEDHYCKLFHSLGTDGVYANDWISSIMRVEVGFKFPFKDLPIHLNSNDLVVQTVVLYRLEIGK